MGKTITFCNHKGGVGKTFLSMNLAATLSKLEKKVLYIDLDPIGGASVALGYDRYKVKANLYNILLSEGNIDIKFLKKPFENFYFLPSTPCLVGAEFEIIKNNKKPYDVLRKKLAELKKVFDYIIIDCAPGFDLNATALAASDLLMIPIINDVTAKNGLLETLNSLNTVKTNYNKSLKIHSFLFNNFYDDSSFLKYKSEICNLMQDQVNFFNFEFDKKANEALAKKKPYVLLFPQSQIALEFNNLVKTLK